MPFLSTFIPLPAGNLKMFLYMVAGSGIKPRCRKDDMLSRQSSFSSEIKGILRSAFNKFDSQIFEDTYEAFTDDVEKYAELVLSKSDESVERAGVSRARVDPAEKLLMSVCTEFKSRLSSLVVATKS